MTRWPYFWSLFGMYFMVGFLEGLGYPEAANILWPFVIGLSFYFTVLRCDDIGINRWWSLTLLIPFATWYFVFAPKRQRLSAGNA